MNDISSKLRKAGLWAWHQKEKMVLAALLIVLCFRVYVVLINPSAGIDDVKTEAPAPKAPTTATTPSAPEARPALAALAPGAAPAGAAAPAAGLTADNVPDPPPRPVMERADDYRPLVRQNPFTIWSAMLEDSGTKDAEGDSIDVTLNNIVKWSDGAYRAELTTKVTGKSKRYKEGEPFESYKLMSIDPKNKSVTIYSSAHDKTFELKMP